MGYAVSCILCVLTGYLCGCFLTAEVVSHKCAGKSAAEIGTGNPGMANVGSQLGKKAGAVVLLGDILKTVVALAIAWAATSDMLGREAFLWTGLSVTVGHNFPFWKKFRGGKGVTVTCTWLILFMPVWGTLSCILGGIITLVTGYLPLGAVLIPLLAVPAAFLTEGSKAGFFMLAALLLMVSKHYSGLVGIVKGTEKRRFRSESR